MPTLQELCEQDFNTVPDMIRYHVETRPERVALIQDDRQVTFRELFELMGRVAAALQRDGVKKGEAVGVCALTSIEYAYVFLGALRAGVAVAPLAPSSTPESLVGMLADSGSKLFFLDASVAADMAGVLDQVTAPLISLDGKAPGQPVTEWLAPEGAKPEPVSLAYDDPFNIIYSSGTTGTPKGIVQSHGMRWQHVRRAVYGGDAVTLISTPLYSNTTLVSFFPTLAQGGTVVMMAKFDVVKYLELAQKHRVSHTMLVPVQYRRLMDYPDFDKYDLSSFREKFSTSAPFSAELKRQVLDRWPGGLTEFFGMTEGGGTVILYAHLHPDKLHTVGQPAPDHEIKLIGEDGKEVAQGEIGEICGRSKAMMLGYHNQPGKTAEAEWYDPEGRRFIRFGDVGRFDADGFLQLMDRKKDMIISGGFNIYPSDLEAVVAKHPGVLEVAVVGVESRAWGETPVAYIALKPGSKATVEEIRVWANGQLGKTQRLADAVQVDALPRSHIGKVMKRELREAYKGEV